MEDKIDFSLEDFLTLIVTPISFIISGIIIISIIYWAFFSSRKSKTVFWSFVLGYSAFGFVIYAGGHWIHALIALVIGWAGLPYLVEIIFSKQIAKENQEREKTARAYQKLVAQEIKREKKRKKSKRKK